MSAADVITALGGPTAVSRKFGVRSNAVSNWKRRGIPKSRRHEVWVECRERGISYDPTTSKIDIRNTTHDGPSDGSCSISETQTIEGSDGKQILNECDKKVTNEDSTKTLGNSVSSGGTIVTTPDEDAAA